KPQSPLHEPAFCICGHRISDHCVDSLFHPFLAATILVTDVNDCVIRVSKETYNCDDLRVCCFRIVSENDLVTATHKPLALCNTITAPLCVLSILAEEMLTPAAVAAHCDPHADEIIQRDVNRSGRWCRCKQNDRRDYSCRHGWNYNSIYSFNLY